MATRQTDPACLPVGHIDPVRLARARRRLAEVSGDGGSCRSGMEATVMRFVAFDTSLRPKTYWTYDHFTTWVSGAAWLRPPEEIPVIGVGPGVFTRILHSKPRRCLKQTLRCPRRSLAKEKSCPSKSCSDGPTATSHVENEDKESMPVPQSAFFCKLACLIVKCSHATAATKYRKCTDVHCSIERKIRGGTTSSHR